MKKTQLELELSLTEIIRKERETTSDLKILGDKIKKDGSKVLYEELERKESNLELLKLTRLKVNQESGNNERIAKLDIIKKKKEVLEKLIAADKKKNIFEYVASLVSGKKKFFTKEEVDAKLAAIYEEIKILEDKLFEFNNVTKVKLQLL